MMKIDRLLLATDFSDWAGRAEEYACSLAGTWHAHLTTMTVLEFPPGLNPEYPVNHQYLTHRMNEATEQLADFKQRALQRGIAVSTRIATGIPSEEIHAAAQAEDSDLIIVGTRGKTGLAHVLLGSTAERVIRTAPCPVLAVHMTKDSSTGDHGIRLERMLVPIDFSDCSLDALEYAAVIAQQSKAHLSLLHVPEPVSYGLDFTMGHLAERERGKEVIEKRLKDLVAAVTSAGIGADYALHAGIPRDAILEAAKNAAADAIVMGTHGRRGLSHIMAGSVTENVLRTANCPVFTVRSPKFQRGHKPIITRGPIQ